MCHMDLSVGIRSHFSGLFQDEDKHFFFFHQHNLATDKLLERQSKGFSNVLIEIVEEASHDRRSGMASLIRAGHHCCHSLTSGH